MPCKMWLAGKVCKRGHSCTYAHVPTSLTKFLAHLNSAQVWSYTLGMVLANVYNSSRG
jgi:hypothetical protein